MPTELPASPIPSSAALDGRSAADEEAEHPQHERGDQDEPQHVADDEAAAAQQDQQQRENHDSDHGHKLPEVRETYTIEQMKRLISPSHTGAWNKVMVLIGERIYERDGDVFRLLDDGVCGDLYKKRATDGS